LRFQFLAIILLSNIFNNKIIAKMTNTWKNPKIIIGNTATGDYYFNRPQIEADIWEEIEKGNHVLIAAPRRVGKSSVMVSMTANAPINTQCVFENIEGLKSDEQFYKKFLELIIQCLNKFQKGTNWINTFFKGINIEEITLEGVKFGDKKAVNYLEEINKILPKLAENKIKVILFLDELPELLNHLFKENRKNEATGILNNMRSWRQNTYIRNHFNLVLAGSVGIHHIVKKIEGRTVSINDLGIVNFDALTFEEAQNYVDWATIEATIQYNELLKNHLLSKINYFIPYFINLMLNEINRVGRKTNNPTITPLIIDAAFNEIVKNSDHFTEWKSRIFDYFSVEDADFMNEVLVFLAHKNTINNRKLYDLAFKHKSKNNYMELIHGLERDGYIVEKGENYQFISPFLKAFWKKDNPIYNGI
jgi:uncharacterized protein